MSRQKSITSAKNWPKTVFGCKAQFCLFSLRTRGGSSADETCYCDFAMLPLKLYILTIEVALSRKLSSFLRLPDRLTYFENYPHNWQWDRADPYPAGIDGATCGPCSGASKAAVKLVKLGDYWVQSWCFFCHISALMSISAWQSITLNITLEKSYFWCSTQQNCSHLRGNDHNAISNAMQWKKAMMKRTTCHCHLYATSFGGNNIITHVAEINVLQSHQWWREVRWWCQGALKGGQKGRWTVQSSYLSLCVSLSLSVGWWRRC